MGCRPGGWKQNRRKIELRDLQYRDHKDISEAQGTASDEWLSAPRYPNVYNMTARRRVPNPACRKISTVTKLQHVQVIFKYTTISHSSAPKPSVVTSHLLMHAMYSIHKTRLCCMPKACFRRCGGEMSTSLMTSDKLHALGAASSKRDKGRHYTFLANSEEGSCRSHTANRASPGSPVR